MADDEVPLPALMRAARMTHGASVRAALADAGCDDVPRNGAFVLGALARAGAPLSEVIAGLGVSTQAAGALVDTRVSRSYLDRTVDPADRRRLRVAPDVPRRGGRGPGGTGPAVRPLSGRRLRHCAEVRDVSSRHDGRGPGDGRVT